MTAEREGWEATELDVLQRLRELREREAAAALATVVDVEGAAYRRPGAKMVLTPNGEQVGAITAGCLAGPVADLAEEVFEDGRPLTRTFDLTDDDEWGFGMGCNGVIDVFVDPVDASLDDALATLDNGEGVSLVTVVDSETPDVPAGARAVVSADGDRTDPPSRESLPDPLVERVTEVAERCAKSGETAIREFEWDGATSRLFVDGVRPPPKLLVFGAQPDAVPVVRLARTVGFEVTVATARGALADPDQFPEAEAVVAVNPTDLPEYVDERTSVVLMSHNLIDDELALAALADTDVPYVGVMGPRKRFAEIRADLDEDGVELPDGFLDRIATPVGLDLGAGAPAEVALSVVSEVLAVENGREGGRLCDKEGPIHGERNRVMDSRIDEEMRKGNI